MTAARRQAEGYEYVGCLHLHSTYSDGTGDPLELVDAAHAAGVDFLALTDHHTPRAVRHGVEGWYGRVLLLAGSEVGRHKGHLLALGIRKPIAEGDGDTRRSCIQIHRQGGLALVAHPTGRGKRLLLKRPSAWRATNMPLVDGLEVWSWMYDWFNGLHGPWSLLSGYLWPERRISGPDPEALALWDRLSAVRPCVGVGSLDAHAMKAWYLPGVVVFPYEQLFRTVCTHVLAPAPTGQLGHDKQALYTALRQGRAFFAHHGEGDPRGFSFTVRQGGDALPMGSRVVWSGAGPQAVVQVPFAGEIRLLRDGTNVGTVTGTEATWELPGPGVYRVEVWRDGRPWIFANPICFAPPQAERAGHR